MRDTELIDALVNKRVELMDRLATLQRELEAARFAITNVEGTIRLFAPDLQLPAATDKRRTPAIRRFRQSELSRLIIKVLRESASGVATADLIAAVMTAKALPPHDSDARAAIARSVSGALGKLKQRGAVVRAEDVGGFFVWRLAVRS